MGDQSCVEAAQERATRAANNVGSYLEPIYITEIKSILDEIKNDIREIKQAMKIS